MFRLTRARDRARPQSETRAPTWARLERGLGGACGAERRGGLGCVRREQHWIPEFSGACSGTGNPVGIGYRLLHREDGELFSCARDSLRVAQHVVPARRQDSQARGRRHPDAHRRVGRRQRDHYRSNLPFARRQEASAKTWPTLQGFLGDWSSPVAVA
jgi:hypothetical protein